MAFERRRFSFNVIFTSIPDSPLYSPSRITHYISRSRFYLDRFLKDVASDLGFTPETLSRALIRLEADGLIARSDRIIILQNNLIA